jgi:hypothetical protein
VPYVTRRVRPAHPPQWPGADRGQRWLGHAGSVPRRAGRRGSCAATRRRDSSARRPAARGRSGRWCAAWPAGRLGHELMREERRASYPRRELRACSIWGSDLAGRPNHRPRSFLWGHGRLGVGCCGSLVDPARVAADALASAKKPGLIGSHPCLRPAKAYSGRDDGFSLLQKPAFMRGATLTFPGYVRDLAPTPATRRRDHSCSGFRKASMT